MSASPSRALVWLRRDLRISDHSAFHAAAQSGKAIVAVFALTPDMWRAHDDAGVKVDFWLRNLRELATSLAARHIPLKVLETTLPELPAALLRLAEACGCEAVHWNEVYELNERCRDEAVRRTFEQAGKRVAVHHDRLIVRPGSLSTQEGRPYLVFTPFRRCWERHVAADLPVCLPSPPVQAATGIPSDTPPREIAGFVSHVSASLAETRWPAGESAARARLEAFSKTRLRAYARQRDRADLDGTSSLSPYLAAGVLSPRQVLRAALDAADETLPAQSDGVATWVSELIWREFYSHLLIAFPRLSMGRAFKAKTEALPWKAPNTAFDAWCEGRTGYPIIDAAMRQLRTQGWMHNRLRMIVAMFLTKDLFIDWRHGERFFMQHLIDGDLAANNGGWQWSASTGTDAQPYFRIFNPASQSQKCDPEGRFLRAQLPELKQLATRDLHDPSRITPLERGSYPSPIVDHARARQHALAAFKAL